MGEVGDRRAEPLLRQELHHRDEAGVELADQVVVADPQVVEGELGGVGLVLADLVEHLADLEALGSGVDAEQRDPLGLLLRRVRAATTTMSAEPPLVMKVFEPLMTQSSPSRTAVVRSAARSEPPDGSVMPIAVSSSPVQKRGSHRSFCSSLVRWTRYGATMSLWMPTQLGRAMLTFASSSVSTALKR